MVPEPLLGLKGNKREENRRERREQNRGKRTEKREENRRERREQKRGKRTVEREENRTGDINDEDKMCIAWKRDEIGKSQDTIQWKKM